MIPAGGASELSPPAGLANGPAPVPLGSRFSGFLFLWRRSLPLGTLSFCLVSLLPLHAEEPPPQVSSQPPPPLSASPSPNEAPAVPAQPVRPVSQQAPEPLNPPPGVRIEEFIGHRSYDKDGSGWGWVKRVNEPWSAARWVVFEETPGGVVAPWRLLNKKRTADNDFEYRLRGYLAPFSVYDPHTDEFLAVFVPESVEPMGPAAPPPEHPGPPPHRVRLPDSSSPVSVSDPNIQPPDALR
ncbi:hypothetical protein MAMC_00417 [Methylacidimicrobium cyclopophantes]|uniref:Uncharacterized protein n=1 Tax=Methylacidimicrobium cyclopophantes TaxID=1041766 RepID=A0A5E6MGD2_9BACT|nr:hypothetical protein [Methylacidimicrobium cyclopophantes]VVM05129.1 hypothetical protein MAMC_00417 [Methylacidimicrobium cyclopophantes]